MTFLELVQALHREAKLTGTAPSAVTAQTGRANDLVQWTIEAWKDIQRQNDGKWKWLRRDFTVDTVADDPLYVYGDCTDVVAAGLITRFRAWDLDNREPPLIYLVSDGEETEREMAIWPWTDFRAQYVKATHTSGYPGAISVDFRDQLQVGPTPDGIYRVTGHYWRSTQALAANGDTPEMPADFHMLIVWRAITKYGYNQVAREVLARATAEGNPLYESLVNNQGWARFSYSVAGPLA